MFGRKKNPSDKVPYFALDMVKFAISRYNAVMKGVPYDTLIELMTTDSQWENNEVIRNCPVFKVRYDELSAQAKRVDKDEKMAQAMVNETILKMTSYAVIGKWSLDKKVYCFYPNLLQDISKSTKQVNNTILDNFPYACFFIDTTKIDPVRNKNYFVCKIEGEIVVVTVYSENGELITDLDSVKRKEISSIDHTDPLYFALKLVEYITSPESDIKENPGTKESYAKRDIKIVKNVFPEIQMFDCGINLEIAFP